jgi:transposase-like protein
VTYFTQAGTFRLYADRCIKSDMLREIARTFALPHIRVARDAHYRCAQCNVNFLD